VAPVPRCPVERVTEESYFFRLSAFQQPLLEHYRNNPDFVVPAVRRNEMLSFRSGLTVKEHPSLAEMIQEGFAPVSILRSLQALREIIGRAQRAPKPDENN
jgi:hypothetical protein